MNDNTSLTLGIETSCDETAAAVYQINTGILSSELYSQVPLHARFGGVVPEIASRSHLEKIGLIVRKALDAASTDLTSIGTIAVTHRPGLPGSLLVGVCFAKALAWSLDKTIIGVDHLEGHIFSSCLEHTVPYPHLCLAASGGHTSLYYVREQGDYTCVGHTLDDAAGEAFDKVAKLIDTPYPGGAVLERMARELHFRDDFHYPRACPAGSLNFSFSGLKTAVLYDLVKRGAYDMASKKFLCPTDEPLRHSVASSLLVCIGDIIKDRLQRALEQYPQVKALTFVGGVACNAYLRNVIATIGERNHIPFFAPSPTYCTDNAAMIAYVGAYKAQHGNYNDLLLDI